MADKELVEFFNNVHQGEQVNFRCIKSGSKPVDFNGYFNDYLEDYLKQTNEQNYEIYFVVNSGGYRDSDINKVNAVFIDLDCGKDNEGNCYDKKIVNDYKYDKHLQIQEFDIPPSYIIETRNGWHVYWLLDKGATKEEFEECQRRLISRFDADKAIKNPSRLMRVPNYYWCKDPNNKFIARICEANDVRYEVTDILEELPSVEGGGFGDNNTKILVSIDAPKTPSRKSEENIKLIREQNVDALQEILQPQPIGVSGNKEVYDVLKEKDLMELLGVQGSPFNCLFHDDTNPSASIFVNKDNGQQLYKCFSDDCKLSNAITIIEAVKYITNLSDYEVVTFLKKLYKITYKDSEWRKEKQQQLVLNQHILTDEIEHYPMIDKIIGRYIDVLCKIHEIASSHIYTKEYTDENETPIFFASTRYLSHMIGKDAGKLSVILSVFTYLGLINKVAEENVPDFLMKKSKREAKKNQSRYLVTYYSIPAYDSKNVDFIVKKAQEYIDNGFTIKGWSREQLLRSLGKEEADRVYPQKKGEKIVAQNDVMTTNIERVALELIEAYGFTTEKYILEYIAQCIGGGKTKYQTQIKRVLPDMLNKYDLRKVQLNKQLKVQMNINDMKGYPKIITFN